MPQVLKSESKESENKKKGPQNLRHKFSCLEASYLVFLGVVSVNNIDLYYSIKLSSRNND